MAELEYTFKIKPWAHGVGHDVERHAAIAKGYIFGRPATARQEGSGMAGPDVVEHADDSASVTYRYVGGDQ